MKKLFFNTIRWVMVLPSSILVMAVVYGLISGSTTYIPIPYLYYVTEFIAGTLSAASFVAAGSHVAPVHKRVTAFVLLGLFLCYSIYAVIDPLQLYTDYGIIESVIYKIGGLLGCFLVARNTK